MNLIETIANDISKRHLTDLEKARLIYLRVCQFFSFDYRWDFAKIFKDTTLRMSMVKDKIDIEDINDFGVICFRVAPQILARLYKELTSLIVTVESSASHSLVLFQDKEGHSWYTDPAYGDFGRVKFNMGTRYFECIDYKYPLDEIDHELGFDFVDEEYYKNQYKGLDIDEIMKFLSKTISDAKCSYFSDARDFFDFVGPFSLVDSKTYANSDYDFHKLIKVFDKRKYFEIAQNENGFYELRKISESGYNRIKKGKNYTEL